jgi:hypothetical protein
MKTMSKELYHKDFMDLLKDRPYYVQNSDEWKWEIPLPNNAPYIMEEIPSNEPSGIPFKEIWAAIKEAFPEDFKKDKDVQED